MDEEFWSSARLRLAVAKAMHRQSFTTDAAAARHWEGRPKERIMWLKQAPRIIDAVRQEAEPGWRSSKARTK